MQISDYSNGGDYECISKNNAYGNTEVTSVDNKSVSISQTVLTELSPSRYLVELVKILIFLLDS